MVEFLQSYGIWIFIGFFFSLMLWGHARGHGMGCCGGHQHNQETMKGREKKTPEKDLRESTR